jgi:hypothetical protein
VRFLCDSKRNVGMRWQQQATGNCFVSTGTSARSGLAPCGLALGSGRHPIGPRCESESERETTVIDWKHTLLHRHCNTLLLPSNPVMVIAIAHQRMSPQRLNYSQLPENVTRLRLVIVRGVAGLSSLSLLVPRNLVEHISGGGERGGMNP